MLQFLRSLVPTQANAVAWSGGLGLATLVFSTAALLALVLLRRRARRAVAAFVLLGLVASAALVLRQGIWFRVGPERLRTLTAMAARPNDPWPRGRGHVPLGVVGAGPREKAYVEPGGGFSPEAGSFGVSFWVFAADGRRLTTSDDIPLARTQQRYIRTEAPGVSFETPFYTAVWRTAGPGTATLALLNRSRSGRMEIVLRGVGPSGGPLKDIKRTGPGAFLLNGDWKVTVDGPASLVFLGAEHGDWTGRHLPSRSSVHDGAGWGVMRLSLPAGGSARLSLVSARAPTLAARALPPGGPGPHLPGLDPRFDASVEAQIGLLEQAIIGEEIAPGDPLNYPLPWLRDGAYALVAMSRSGQTARVRVLARPFAKRDYFGGFGAEADAPGLALWALGEASVAVDDPSFDRSLWPDVVRKVSLIERLLAAREPVRAAYSGSIVPRSRHRKDLDLVADPSRDGLIQGRMDWQRPVFYVNAVTVAGLESASRMAARLGHAPEAAAWAREAGRLRMAWRRAFAVAPSLDPQRNNERTAIAGLWPGEVAESAPFGKLLEERWARTRLNTSEGFREPPLWTYFTVAEAHQWLRLRRPERAWTTMIWFWDHQPAPGLYTLWEGDGEENSFGLWRGTRGWVQPGGVTPHYWSAAEMLLLQLAMLAEVEGPPAERVLTIGSGVPASWFSRPFSVSGIGTSAGPVAWSWDGKVVTVRTAAGLPVQLGPTFPAGAKLKVIRASDV